MIEVGSGAALDGTTALCAAGLTGYDDDVQLSVRHGTDPHRPGGIVVRELIAWRSADIVAAGLPRVRPVIAAVRAAAWAHTDRQAALILLLTVQQRLATAASLLEHAQGLVQLSRRRVIEAVLRDAVSGVQALGELDFARLCRKRGLPEPTRQVLRATARGNANLDVEWDALAVVVEIDGRQHAEPITQVVDALRQNEVAMGSRIVLRIPNLGLILEVDRFMNQLGRVLWARMAAARRSQGPPWQKLLGFGDTEAAEPQQLRG